MTIPFAQSSFAEIYEQNLVGPLFRPFAERIVEDLALASGERVLDLACGTGVVARLARERVGPSGTVLGVDLSPAMVGHAARLAPELEFREGDASALPLRAGETFDAVVCQQGFQFFPDRSAAAREMHRALVPGGRIALSTWCADDAFPFLRELRRVAERHVGPIEDRRHAVGEPGPIEVALREAGFRDLRSRVVSHGVRFEQPDVFVRLNAMAMIGMAEASKAMSDEERGRKVEAIVADSAAATRAHTKDGQLAYDLAANVVMGVR
jgi:ubiquinone/menaquinone biosynthesis C-methylase UbiE